MSPRRRAILTVLAAAAAGCGARSGLDDRLGPDGDADADADADVDADADGDLDADADADPIACDGRPYPKPGAAVVVDMPARMQSVGVLVPDPLGILLVGGYTWFGEPAEEMAFFDLSTGEVDELPVVGDAVVLPDREAAAVHVPIGDQVIVIGGNGPDGPLEQVFLVQGEGDPSGLRQVRATRIADYPGGPVRGVAAVWDPIEAMIVAHGGVGDGDVGGTWGLHLGEDAEWIVLRFADESPPPGVRAMGVDPTGTILEVTDDEDGSGLAVYATGTREGILEWSRLAEIDFAPSTRGELLYDPSVCGFHLLSARQTRCTLEHWVLTRDGRVVFRGDTELFPSHFLASAAYVQARDELVVYGSEDCDAPGVANLAAHRIPLVR